MCCLCVCVCGASVEGGVGRVEGGRGRKVDVTDVTMGLEGGESGPGFVRKDAN